MNNYSLISIGSIYEIQRKALAKSACTGDNPAFMRGICEMVSGIEGFLLDEEAEKAAEAAHKEATE